MSSSACRRLRGDRFERGRAYLIGVVVAGAAACGPDLTNIVRNPDAAEPPGQGSDAASAVALSADGPPPQTGTPGFADAAAPPQDSGGGAGTVDGGGSAGADGGSGGGADVGGGGGADVGGGGDSSADGGGGADAGCAEVRPTCQAVGASCGTPFDGCGGVLACGGCPDPLTSCGDAFSCACGRPTALYSPAGSLEADRRAVSPDGAWYATAAGVFVSATGRPVWPLPMVKAFDWHPAVAGRFAQMEHYAPPRPTAVVTVYQLSPDGTMASIVARATSDLYHHALAWADADRIALGAVDSCTTIKLVIPTPLP